MSSFRLIGLAGLARTGKDTAAAWLSARYGLVQMSFAEPIRDGLRAMFALGDDELHGADKERPLDWCDKSPRELMQTLGTEWGRDLVHPELWLRVAGRRVQAASERIPEARGVVFSDVRFGNEARWIRERGGMVIHIRRRSAPVVRGHVSEVGVSVAEGDAVVDNDGSRDELYRALDLIVGA